MGLAFVLGDSGLVQAGKLGHDVKAFLGILVIVLHF